MRHFPEQPVSYPAARKVWAMAAGKLMDFSAAPLVSGAPATTVNPSVSKNRSFPNILLLVADDLGWGDVGFHGGLEHTPAFDRLARESLEIQRFYVYPACCPTRAALFTGQLPRPSPGGPGGLGAGRKGPPIRKAK